MDTNQVIFVISCVLVIGLVNFTIARPAGVRGCGRPTRIDRGNYIVVGNKTIYNCAEGYHLLGEKSVECNGKQWLGNPPICAASGCGTLGLLVRGTIVYNHDLKVASFKCDDDYALEGPEVIVCVEKGWSDPMPKCTAKTKPILTKHQQDLLESDYSCITKKNTIQPPGEPFTKRATEWAIANGTPRLYTVYRCDWGYVPVGVNKNVYCKNGRWIGGGIQQCKYVGKFSHDKNEKDVDLTKGDRSHEDWIHISDYSCSSKPNPVSPPELDNSDFQIKVAITDGMPHMFVKYVCDDGYKNQNDQEFMYCKNKKWWGTEPKCVQH